MSHDLSLEQILRAVEPAVRLISERHLRQVLHYLIDWGHPLPINTNLAYWVSLEDLLAADILPPDCVQGAGPLLLLLTDAGDRMIEALPRSEQLRIYWRSLFKAAIARALEMKVANRSLSRADCEERLASFGAAAAREIAYVLLAEHLVAPNSDAIAQYCAFAATYLDLISFDSHLVASYFPTLPSVHKVGATLSQDVDGTQLLAETRPDGAADPHLEPSPDLQWEAPESDEAVARCRLDPALALGRADEAEQRGNHVRAAILRTQVAAIAAEPDRDRIRKDAEDALGKLIGALAEVFDWDADLRREWHQSLCPLLEHAARGVWSRAARCLYELQKVPADLAREVYAIDLAEFIRTFGHRPVKRPLPYARPVLILMSLKKAQGQMLRAGLGIRSQVRIDRLFHHQIQALERTIRHDLTPVVTVALVDAGFEPRNTVEEVARDKIVAELLDRVCERGYLRLGNLRDAIARNRLKMADLAGPGEFFRGDSLLRADINLAYAVDGVYRKGEFYLRWIQRMISLFFGTNLGRGFTLYIAAPFGGAFLALMFLEELRHMGSKIASIAIKPAAAAKLATPMQTKQGEPPESPDLIVADEVHVGDDGEFEIVELSPNTITSDDVRVGDDGEVIWYGTEPGAALVTDVFTSSATAVPAKQPHGSILIAWPTILGFGVFLLLMFHVRPFRRAVFTVLRYTWRFVRGALWDLPVGLWRSRTIRGFLQSRPVRFLVRHFWSPLLITLLAFVILPFVGVSPWFLFRWWWAIWAGLTLMYIPWRWLVQDRIAEAVSDWWRIVRVNLLPGLIATIIDAFKMLANWIERKLYAVDEWLRFRGGDSQGSLATKAILGLIWFPIAYAFRFIFYLLVEPQINPVKHFPVVTVSHKVIWPMVPEIAELTGLSVLTVSTFVNGIPGIFGFIAWELKENWRLYEANSSSRLRPVTIGSHGESMRGLLRPGFHSGTVPTLYRKLRHADPTRATWLHHELVHTAEGVSRFVERELIDLLERSSWRQLHIRVDDVHFGCQRLAIELTSSIGGDSVVLAFENIGGRIEASLDSMGWFDHLTEPQRVVLVAALRGLLDMAAAERVDGKDRVEGTVAPVLGCSDLARRVTWTEWSERWNNTAPTTIDSLAKGT